MGGTRCGHGSGDRAGARGRRRRHRLGPRRGRRRGAGALLAGAVTALRLVATDLDGTLLGDDGRLTVHTEDVLRRVQQLGVRVVIVTARPLRWMDGIWTQV